MDALYKVQADQKGAGEQDLKRNMAEINQKLQSESMDAESSNLFGRKKTRIKQLEVDIAKVMEERSYNAHLATAT